MKIKDVKITRFKPMGKSMDEPKSRKTKEAQPVEKEKEDDWSDF